jgi:3-methyladenine DNA glycosylase AlkC
MSRIGTFTFRVNAEERRLLTALADYLQRSQSDALRWLIRQAAREVLTNAPAQLAHHTDAAPRVEGGEHAAND